MPASVRAGHHRHLLLALVPALVLAIPLIFLAFSVLRPAPPSIVRLATGDPSGAYHAYGERYRDALLRSGIRVELVASGGSVDNIALLRAGKVDIAFVQSGAVEPEEAQGLVGVASLYREPLWIFHRLPGRPNALGALRGKRIAIGAPGSATQRIVRRMLAANEIDPAAIELHETGAAESARLLRAGEIDAAFLFSGLASPLIGELLSDPSLRLMSLVQAEAYGRLMPAIDRLVLPRGAVSLARDVPPRDVELLGSVATLVARDEFHPALVYLMLRTARELHGDADLLSRPNDFPALPKTSGFEVAEEAERFFAQGTPLIYRWLPFWLANLLVRLLVILVPVVALIVPLTQWAPRIYRWRAERPIRKALRELREIERAVDAGGGADPAALGALAERLDGLERRLRDLQPAVPMLADHYSLLDHVAAVRARLGPPLNA